jgi:hypothetical protein
MIKISHSGRGKYDHCPRMFRLHYNDKIRPVGSTSSLLFGSAIDVAAEHYLLNGEKELAIQLFVDKWNQQEINGILSDLKTCKDVSFHANDFDHELLTESDNELILKDSVFETVSDLVEAGTDKEKVILANWYSLYRKGLILIDAFIEWVNKNVDEVLEAQCLIELEDADGNEITGKADFVVKTGGYDIPLLVDLKTAARYYERSSVKTSEQLALYWFYLKNTKYPEMKRCAYLVLSKQIKKNRIKTCQKCGTITTGKERLCAAGGKGKKRCNGEFDVQITPEASIQFIHDEIPMAFVEQTIERFGIAINQIQAGEFDKNLAGCDSYYGKPCPYREYCKTGCMDGLFKKEEK